MTRYNISSVRSQKLSFDDGTKVKNKSDKHKSLQKIIYSRIILKKYFLNIFNLPEDKKVISLTVCPPVQISSYQSSSLLLIEISAFYSEILFALNTDFSQIQIYL